MRKFAFLLLVLLLPPKVVWAQTGAVVSYQLDVFDISVDPAGTGRPRWTGTIPKEAVSCNQPPLQPPTKLVTQNPSVVYWNDAANVGRICKASTVLLGTLPPMVPGDYVLTVSLTNDREEVSPRSVASLPFNNSPPVALTGVGVR